MLKALSFILGTVQWAVEVQNINLVTTFQNFDRGKINISTTLDENVSPLDHWETNFVTWQLVDVTIHQRRIRAEHVM